MLFQRILQSDIDGAPWQTLRNQLNTIEWHMMEIEQKQMRTLQNPFVIPFNLGWLRMVVGLF